MNNGQQDHWRNEDMLKEANVENIAVMMRRRRLAQVIRREGKK